MASTPLDRMLRGHMPALDGLRGIAILLVLAHRFGIDESPRSIAARVLAAGMEGGWVGVQLFFVLSGFLITGILLDGRAQPGYYRNFFTRRILRIFPLYYTVLIIAFAALPAITGRQLDGYEHQGWLWVYLANWTASFGMGVAAFPHFWSLSVEEQFYLVWPFVVRRSRSFVTLCLSLMAAALVSRIVLRATDASPRAVYELTVCRMDALIAGALAAWALRVPGLVARIVARLWLLIVGTLLLLLAGARVTHNYIRLDFGTQTIGYSIFCWSFTLLLIVAVLSQARGGPFSKMLSVAPLRALGKYSYAMYIFHFPLHHLLGTRLLAVAGVSAPGGLASLGYLVCMTGVCFALAFASYHIVEKHFLRLKDRFPMGAENEPTSPALAPSGGQT